MTTKIKDDLTDIPGVGKETARKLEAAGYNDFMTLAVSSQKEIAEKCDIGEKTINSILASARELMKVDGFISATELKEKRKEVKKLTTCSKSLDNLFKNPRSEGSGLQSQAITEFYGEFGCGKTQICLQLAVNATMPVEKGGLGTDVIYIDTENTFRPERIEQIALGLGLDEKEVLSKIHVARPYTSAHQILLVEEEAYKIAKDVDIGLLVVDSLTSHFRSEYIGRGTLQERQGLLSRHMRELLRFAYVNNAIVAVTNQVMAKPDAFFGDPTRPVGGHIVGHASTYRVYLRKAGKGGKRVARMVDAPDLVEDEVIINVSEVGIRDDGDE